MNVILNYGRNNVSAGNCGSAEFLEGKEPEYNIDKEQFLDALWSVLPDLKGDNSRIGVVVSDKTRLCEYPLYLPWLLEALIKKGALKENITFYIAYGTHKMQTDPESLNCYGNAFNEYRFVHHSCVDSQSMSELGHTKRGTKVKIREDILKCSLLIAFGSVSHHYFAGYGGGRKLFFPGLAGKESIYQNHGLFLNKEKKQLHLGCQPGKLEGNPVAEDLKEIEDLLPPRISIHGILNSKGLVCKLMIGSSYNDFLEVCSEYDKYYKSGIDKQFDMVVASSGGSPKDINFIQAHKALHNAATFVKDGGKLILLAECVDGIGSETFLKYFKLGGFDQTFKALMKNYEGNGGTALSLMTKTKRIKIYMYTSLDENLCKILQVKKINERDLKSLIKLHSGSCAIIKNASLFIK